MGDVPDHADLGWLLNALVAIVLVGTFVLYGIPGEIRNAAVGPDELAILASPR